MSGPDRICGPDGYGNDRIWTDMIGSEIGSMVYDRLSHNCDAIIDHLLASHSYIFPQIFDAEGLPSPKRQKPYQGQPVVDTLYEVFFENAKSIGLQFAQCFVDIAKNKASRLEVPIPMVAIVSTAIHATLIAKKNKAGDDFKFTGNQFCDIYTYHVALLEKIQRTAPIKFHKMMADIYEEVQGFCRDTIGVYDKDTDLALLDLDGMDDEQNISLTCRILQEFNVSYNP
ncbi:hypothetical protein BDR07DRAFT_1496969 [Suillus spraguei]|nr:hypothetical protein BDR07DRAFT_1496969 [Suillus spraguei]